jgi:hypothetical protein
MSKDPRHLEDHEIYEGFERSQAPIPYWLIVLTLIVLGVGLVLSIPFMGNRATNPGTFFSASHTRSGWDGGTIAVLFLIALAFGIVYWATKRR